MNDREKILSKVDVFFGLASREREALLNSVSEIKVEPKAPLFTRGTAAEFAYVIFRGQIKTFRKGPNGRNFLVDFFREGELLGYESVLFGGEHEVDAVCISPSLVLAVPSSTLRESLESNPRMGVALSALAASRARAYRERLCLMGTCPVQVRLFSVLHGLARRFGQRHQQGTMIGIKLTHQDLANYIGASRETVSHLLSKFREQGIIANNVRRLVIPDMKTLKKLAEQKE